MAPGRSGAAAILTAGVMDSKVKYPVHKSIARARLMHNSRVRLSRLRLRSPLTGIGIGSHARGPFTRTRWTLLCCAFVLQRRRRRWIARWTAWLRSEALLSTASLLTATLTLRVADPPRRCRSATLQIRNSSRYRNCCAQAAPDQGSLALGMRDSMVAEYSAR